MRARSCAGVLLLILLSAPAHGAEETLPSPGSWVRYAVEIPARLPPDEAYRPETPAPPTIRRPDTEKEKRDKSDPKKAPPDSPPDTKPVTPNRDRFVFTLRILPERSGAASILVELGEGAHTIRQRVDPAHIPVLSGTGASLMHLPATRTEDVPVGNVPIRTRVLTWTRNGQEVQVWRSERVPFGVVRIVTAALRLELLAFAWADAPPQQKDNTE